MTHLDGLLTKLCAQERQNSFSLFLTYSIEHHTLHKVSIQVIVKSTVIMIRLSSIKYNAVLGAVLSLAQCSQSRYNRSNHGAHLHVITVY